MKKKHLAHTKKEQSLKQPQSLPHLLNGTLTELRGAHKWKNLFAAVDISGIVFFRILFGFIMLVEVLRYFKNDWIRKYWIDPDFLFNYWPFNFLSALPGNGMYLLFFLLGVTSVFIMLGLFYRVSIFVFFTFFTYTFLLEQTRYLNHFYLVVLISFIMLFIPANRAHSLDSRLFKNTAAETVPAWCLWLLRFTIALPYFFGGIAKINSDWLQGEPLRMWLSNRTHVPVIGPLLQYEWMIYFMVYSGLLLDLLVVPALLISRTRKWAFIIISLFHLLNTQLFSIGIFPWFMIAATSIYFDPGWFRKLKNGFNGNKWPLLVTEKILPPQTLQLRHKTILALLFFWVGVQVILPVRHFFIPGSVHWTEQGHLYAWHMKLRSKRGKGEYRAKDKITGQEYKINPLDYLMPNQISKVNRDPYLIWQFCQLIKKDF
ncbi:MAG: HTTM domain-containing protein, partial [Gloeobacteraceae cyanobacterium ES-bin-316]|nr:HTTM domain-containing protein [Ferruginibacter sp.]